MTFGTRLQEDGVATAATLQQIEHEAAAAIEDAIAFAKASPLPKPEDALLDVFAP
jgi:TPP-dependent pyruvate/acetoin dehydrogenase alpha subunit